MTVVLPAPPTVGAPAVTLPQAHRRALVHLRHGQRYAPFRRVVGATAFRWASRGGTGVLAALAAFALAGLGSWTAVHATPATYLAGLALATLLAEGVLARRALDLQSRVRVARPPDLGLLQALDVRVREVFWVDLGRSIVTGQAVLLVAQVVLLLSQGPTTPGGWSLLTVPVGAGALLLALTAHRCARTTTTRPGLGSLAVTAVLSAATGLLAGRLLEVLLGRGTAAVTPALSATLVAGVTGAGLVAGLSAALLGPGARRRLDAVSWRGDVSPPPGERRSATGSEYARMRDAVARSALAGSVLGVWRTVVLVAAFAAGVVTAGPALPPTVQHVVVPLLTGYAFVTVLVASGVVLSLVGPSAMLPRFRFQWEMSGDNASRIAVRGLAYPLAVVTVPASLLTAAQSMLGGRVSLRTLALAVALVGSAVIAESVLPVAHHSDGTITHHPLTAWVVLIVSAPVAAMPTGVVGSLLSMGYALTCLGAGHRCLYRRILTLPSSSAA